MAQKIVEQTKTWTTILRGTAASLDLEASLAALNDNDNSAERIRSHADTVRDIAKDIHARFVEGNENKPPRTRKSRTAK